MKKLSNRTSLKVSFKLTTLKIMSSMTTVKKRIWQ